jgi:hypothetical protein
LAADHATNISIHKSSGSPIVIRVKQLDRNLVVCSGLAVILVVVMSLEVTAAEPTLKNSDPNELIEWTRKIFSDGKWNATPDITYWRGHYYVAINQGKKHNGLNGQSIVIRSSDLVKWERVHATDRPSVDCKFLALPERLMLYHLFQQRADVSKPQGPDNRNYIETRVTVTEDGTDWSESKLVYKPLQNLWRPKVHNGVIYVANDFMKLGRSDYVTAEEEANPLLYHVELLCSSDGFEWDPVSTILKGNPHFPITETAIAFLPDGELFAFTRQNFISRSKPPYTTWTNENAKMASGGIGGPSLITFGNDLFVSGRYYGYLKDHGLASSPQTNRIATSLWKYNHQEKLLDRIADFPRPAYADLGYTGFVATDEGVFMVYYSGHEYGETAAARNTKADIFLSKLRIGGHSAKP